MDIESRLAEVAKGWIDEREGALLAHPESAVWSRYNAGELPPEEVERLRDHLVSCRSCRAVVLETPKAGTAIAPEPASAPSEAERQALHELRRRVSSIEPGIPAEETPPPAWVPPASAARSPLAWISSSVVVLSLAVAGWTWYQSNQPRLDVVIAEAVPVGQVRGVARPGAAEAPGRPMALLLPLPGLVAGTPVRIEILDGVGAVEWRGEGRATADGEYGLEIPARFRRIAGGQVRISVPEGGGEAPGAWKALGTFQMIAP